LFAMYRCAASINNPTAIIKPANAIVPKTVHLLGRRIFS
jgi:hypothetical protein